MKLGRLSAALLHGPAMLERHAPHPVPLPVGEGTPSQRLRPNSLSHGERAGVRGVTLVHSAIQRQLAE
jgi:hypothetical protein